MKLQRVVLSVIVVFVAGAHTPSMGAMASSYTVGGTVTGLAPGTYLTLTDNGSDTLTIPANGTFQFSATLTTGSNYSVAVVKLPTGEQCGVANATGKIATADVSTVAVKCAVPKVRLLAGALGGPGNVDGSRTTARFYYPEDVGLDQAGNLYIADDYNRTVRKLTPAGQVTTLAGSPGQYGIADGKGPNARFSNPIGLAVDPTGVVYVVDAGVNTIRRISPTGMVTTLAGTPNTSGMADGTGPAAQFWNPTSIRFSPSGSLYLTDNNRIRNITPGGVVTTIYSGFTPLEDYALAGFAVASSGAIYASAGNINGVIKIDLVAQVTSSVANGIYGPVGVTIAPPGSPAAGTVYVSDGFSGSATYSIDGAGLVSPFAGSTGQYGFANGTGTAARFYSPTFMLMTASGTQYIADTGNNAIRKVTPAGVVSTVAGVPARPGHVDAKGGAARFDNPEAMAIDGAGTLYVADANGTRKVTSTGVVTTVYTQAGMTGFAVDAAGTIYFSPWNSNAVAKVTHAGVLSIVAGSTTMQPGSQDGIGAAARFNRPNGVAIDTAGNLYVADTSNFTIRKVSPAGRVTTVAGSPLVSGTADGVGSKARFSSPFALTVDVTGTIYVVDGSAVRKISPSGLVTTLAGSQTSGYADGVGLVARFNAPSSIAVSPLGTVFVSDGGNNAVRKIMPSGLVTTAVGKHGQAGVKLGGLPATINLPVGLAYFDSTLFVVDAQENSVLAVSGLF